MSAEGVPLRRIVHRGSVPASGLTLDTRLVPMAEARARLLALGEVGADVHRFGSLLVVRLRQPVRVDCAAAAGAPLVRYGRLLSPAPLAPDEETALATAEESVVAVAGGVARCFPFSDDTREDVSSWIDLDDFVVVGDPRPLGAVAALPRPAILEAAADVRQALGAAPLTKDAADVLASMARARAADGPEPRSVGGGGGGLRALLDAIADALRALFTRRSPSPAATGGAAGARPRGSRLRDLFARALWRSRLARWLGRQHARYLARLVEMFDSGDLDSALRHAIPLDDKAGGPASPPPLRAPSPRADLLIRPHAEAARGSLGLGGDLFASMRALYRRAFERLEAAGEIEKAAFVLAELLGATEEAVAFLERHGRVRLAAEIAEARGLPAGLVVRLWFLAGERPRAVRIARRTGAFADAVLRLEASHRDEAMMLRMLWGDALASTGAYAAAVDAIWPFERARRLALAWIDRAIAVGGPTGARMLARKLGLMPEAFTELRDRALALLGEAAGGEDGARAAHAFAGELVTGAPATDETRALCGPAARALLRSIGATADAAESRGSRSLLNRLLDAGGDLALGADVRAAIGHERAAAPRGGPIRIRAAGRADKGRQRAACEDWFLAAWLDGTAAPREATTPLEGSAVERGIVLGVFDGTGGGHVGLTASRTAAVTVQQELRRLHRQLAVPATAADAALLADGLAAAVQQANRDIFTAAATDPVRRGSASTATVATLAGSTLLVAQVGDSRGYLLRGGALVQVTRDHTLLHELATAAAAGGKPPMTPEEVEAFPHKNVITRVLGLMDDVQVDVFRVELAEDDVILLCSDGLWGVLDDKAIRDVLTEARDPVMAARMLHFVASRAGAPDDIAIVAARVGGKGLRQPRGAPVVVEAVTPARPGGDGAATPAPSLRARPAPVELERSAADAGSIAIKDAARLPDGRTLVALGELGVWLLSREGKPLTRFAQPADRIVISDHGDRAIVGAARGDEVVRLARLDLLSGRAEPWCDARIDGHAGDFDGSLWFVARGSRLYAIDATAAGWEHVWSVDEPGARFASIRRDERTLGVWVDRPGVRGGEGEGDDDGERDGDRDGDNPDETWTYELPSITLRLRQPLAEPGAARPPVGSVAPGGAFAGWHKRAAGVMVARAYIRGAWHDLPVPAAAGARPTPAHVTEDWIALPAPADGGALVSLLDTRRLEVRARITLGGDARAAGVRLQSEHLLVFDAHGRLLVLSLETGALLHDHRLT